MWQRTVVLSDVMRCLPMLGTGGDEGRVYRAKWHTRCDVRLQRQLLGM